ncbi:hypothetical protein [Pyrobaculum ferrireducens]|uniref:hypothetical protein n=1 Tax=Pyrobaculum ferrireducens TaxID=1104324 RepID=UPI000A5B41B9|nr:hypothetical protein [Pyrobaculum ferrireducens]
MVLYYTLEKRIDGVKYELERRIEGVDRKIKGVREELNGRVEGVKAELGGRISGLKGMVEELRHDVKSLGVAFYNYQNTLIDFLATKGVVSAFEAVLLRGALRILTPVARSRYYTEEVRRRLLELLDKDVESYT